MKPTDFGRQAPLTGPNVGCEAIFWRCDLAPKTPDFGVSARSGTHRGPPAGASDPKIEVQVAQGMPQGTPGRQSTHPDPCPRLRGISIFWRNRQIRQNDKIANPENARAIFAELDRPNQQVPECETGVK